MTLEDIPKLTKCTLLTAFKCVEKVKMKNASKLEEMKALVNAKVVAEGVVKKTLPMNKSKGERSVGTTDSNGIQRTQEKPVEVHTKAVVTCMNEWDTLRTSQVNILVVASRCCNEEGLTVLPMSWFVHLREFRVGHECFENVREVQLIELSELKSVEVGENSFTKKKNWFGSDPSRCFYLKNCPRLKSLKIGKCSFSDYTTCEIEKVDCLKVIEIGDVTDWSRNFSFASLELKSG